MEQQKEYRINNSNIKVIFGNILDSQAEVIVSSDDCNITMGGGVFMVTLGTGTCHTTELQDNGTGNKDVIEIRKYEI